MNASELNALAGRMAIWIAQEIDSVCDGVAGEICDKAHDDTSVLTLLRTINSGRRGPPSSGGGGMRPSPPFCCETSPHMVN